MKQLGLERILLGFVLLMTNHVYATDAVESAKPETTNEKNTLSINALHAYWAFSGTVSNENGELYNYYFQMQRKDNQFHAVATLINNQSKEVLLYEESDKTIEHFVATNWHVGRAFMQFNPINNSWVFGVTTKNHIGFNFKIDMLGQPLTMPLSQGLRSGIELLVNQTGRLNGHIQAGEKVAKDQFVTAPKAWFKQIWVSKSQESRHPLTGVLCQFNDGSGFFAVNLQEPDALRGAVAGWRDVEGTVIPMSQFVSVKEKKDGLWSIRIPSPKIRLSLEDALAKGNEKHHLIAGLSTGKTPGFCTITMDEIGEQPQQFVAKEVEKKTS
ncbi:MAG: hypothetical protein H0T84_08760 [Tatlockia sp.]|nr:hypothetical protein [Tatlockia sp.]